jgi:hypothetical protein
MNIDDAFREQLLRAFFPLNSVAASKAFPAPSTLSTLLESMIPKGSTTRSNIDAKSASYFATAAVEIWLRGVHSFLISGSLTETSPIWASVSGYYASHYCVRAVAHLLGYFQLFRKKKIVQLKFENGRHVCIFNSKAAHDGEHQLYWRIVKQDRVFQGDDLFTLNNSDSDASDIRHRNHANYADHIFGFPIFHAIDSEVLKDRIEYISKIVFDSAPVPRLSAFPDIEYVQLIAYRRIVSFRKILDEVLGTKNRFWNVHRNPSFAAGFMDFQLAEGGGLAQLSRN